MKKALWLAAIATITLFLAVGAQAQTATINGAGASFPYPIYSQWAYKYHQLTGIKINYQSIGSGGGIAQIKSKTVDFGASDEPLKPEELEKSGLLQFPMVIGGVVPVVNIQGIAAGQLRLTGDTLAQIFLGNITKWDDPAIKKLNPEVKLPAQAISVVHRSDGSGTTWIFTNYLDKVSPAWHQKVGSGKAVQWPAANSVGGKGNEGVASYVKKVAGSIGYVEYAYALQNKMTVVLLKNRVDFVAPSIQTFQAAAANADWEKARDFYMVLTDQPDPKSWPIVGATYILVYRHQPDAGKGQALLKFFDWCYKHGGEMAEELDYVPLPDNVVKLVESAWKEVKAGGKTVWP